MAPIELLSDCKLPCEYGKECQLRVYGDPEEKTTIEAWSACVSNHGIIDLHVG